MAIHDVSEMGKGQDHQARMQGGAIQCQEIPDGSVNLHSKQLCVPLRIFLRFGNVSSLGILTGYCSHPRQRTHLTCSYEGFVRTSGLAPHTGFRINGWDLGASQSVIVLNRICRWSEYCGSTPSVQRVDSEIIGE